MILLEASQQIHFANFDKDDVCSRCECLPFNLLDSCSLKPAARRSKIEFPSNAYHFQLESGEEVVQVWFDLLS